MGHRYGVRRSARVVSKQGRTGQGQDRRWRRARVGRGKGRGHVIVQYNTV